VIFLHKIVPGAADKSYGIHVARLAGVPRAVVERSKEILVQLEEEHLDAEGRAKIARPAEASKAAASKKTHLQLTLFTPADHPVVEELRRLDLDNLTPLQALERLQRWKEEVQRDCNRRGGGLL